MKNQVAYHITFLYGKIILKIQENHLMPHYISLLKNNSENSNSMPHHLIPHHISPWKIIQKTLENVSSNYINEIH
jgi:hypothetical protein